ncbi:MAG: hypothetical protein MJ177_06260, partial [Clostridia bacterium]|nr:hypothetical protein [Clostridia bacterium]
MSEIYDENNNPFTPDEVDGAQEENSTEPITDEQTQPESRSEAPLETEANSEQTARETVFSDTSQYHFTKENIPSDGNTDAPYRNGQSYTGYRTENNQGTSGYQTDNQPPYTYRPPYQQPAGNAPYGQNYYSYGNTGYTPPQPVQPEKKSGKGKKVLF